MTPQLVDFNGDGYQDMVMATFEGTAFLVEGTKEGWKKPVHIEDENETNVRISMYYDIEKDDYSTVDRSTDDYKTNEDHHMTSIGVVDWDNDGDLDLILGAYEGGLYRCMNIGTKTEPKFEATNQQFMAGGKVLEIASVTTPRIVDWDQDGLFDVLLGTNEGEVHFLKNTGKKGEPEFAAPKSILNVSSKLKTPIKAENCSINGISDHAYIEAVDYDGDGDLDLLVGTHTDGKQESKELTDEEKEKLKELKAKSEEINKKIGDLMKDVESAEEANEIYEDPENEKLFEEMSELYEAIEEIEPYFSSPHLIWLYRNTTNDHRKESGLKVKTTSAKKPKTEGDS